MTKALLMMLFLLGFCHAEEPTAEDKPKNSEIEKIDARLAELTLIWKQETAIINHLTNNKRTPVQEGTQAYYKCVAASKRIQQAEAETKPLQEKRKQIQAVSREKDQNSIQDAALAKMTDAEKLELLEKLKREVGSDTVSSPRATKSDKEKDTQGAGNTGIQTDEIKPQNRPTLENLSPLRKNLVGYWISSKKVKDPPTYDLDKGVTEDDLGEEAKLAKKITENMGYGYSCYGAEAFWDVGEWVPYDEIKDLHTDRLGRVCGFDPSQNGPAAPDGGTGFTGTWLAWRRAVEAP